ncbi:hypothetical protein MSMAC_0885 [Methanosarcina mazei C16]|uniref:Uncharacterized protein n=1 Tax=Methanosarcina mazei C16 TaxID=1434113 RepID=A0A0E3WRA6_METMZ|nr:hypothetical protein MSMAC_0885 [Methanosarcina mazei C16]
MRYLPLSVSEFSAILCSGSQESVIENRKHRNIFPLFHTHEFARFSYLINAHSQNPVFCVIIRTTKINTS